MANLKQSVSMFNVDDLPRSLAFYRDGLSFEVKNQWIVEGRMRWCWIERDGVALMLQETVKPRPADQRVGLGVTTYFICEDALAIYREAISKGLSPEEPFVGNNMWVVIFHDPDGYEVTFESVTDVPEGTTLAESGL